MVEKFIERPSPPCVVIECYSNSQAHKIFTKIIDEGIGMVVKDIYIIPKTKTNR